MSLADWFNRNYGVSQAPVQTGYRPSEVIAKELAQAGISIARKQFLHQAPSRDEFETWRDDPVTMFVMAALLRNADECREEWLRKSWSTGEADQTTLVGLRERADALLGFTADYEAFCETLGLQPEEEEAA